MAFLDCTFESCYNKILQSAMDAVYNIIKTNYLLILFNIYLKQYKLREFNDSPSPSLSFFMLLFYFCTTTA